MNWKHWLTHPREAALRLRYFAWEKLHPNSPWLCPGTVRFCERSLTPSMTALEYGSGRSTVWFAKRLARLTSVEHNADWFVEVAARVAAEKLTNVDYRLVPLEHPEPEGERSDYDPVPAYIRVADDLPDASLDLVIVDGHYRSHCIRRAVPKLRPGGFLLVDDVNFWPAPEAVPVPAAWTVANDSTNGLKRCIVWRAS
jgi:predicted O-methyltransferase YrrM